MSFPESETTFITQLKKEKTENDCDNLDKKDKKILYK